jgi:hypothetical protein
MWRGRGEREMGIEEGHEWMAGNRGGREEREKGRNREGREGREMVRQGEEEVGEMHGRGMSNMRGSNRVEGDTSQKGG